MKILKKLIAVMAIAAMSMSFTACSANDSKDPAVAKVGDVTITKSQLDSAMYQTDAYLQMSYGEDFKENAQVVPLYNNMLDQNVQQLIGTEILIMKAKEMGITVTEDEVEEKFSATKSSFETDESFSSALTAANMTEDSLKKEIERGLYYQKIVEDYQNKTEVTDQELQDYYNQNIADYTQKPGATISHILVDSEDKAKEVLQKYKDGTSFEDLAAEYGTDGTKSTGGSLGYIEYDTQQYDQDFMAAAKKLGEGEVSDPVKTQFGWHLIKVDGIQKEESVQPFDEVKDTIKETVAEQKTNEAISTDVENWKKEYKIETYAENYQLTVPEETAASDSEADNAEAAESTPEASK